MTDDAKNKLLVKRRPMVAALAACLAGALFSYIAVRFDFLAVAAIFAAILLAGLCLALRGKRVAVILSVLFAVCFAVTSVNFSVKIPIALEKTDARITATVKEVKQANNGSVRVIVTDLVAEGVPFKGLAAVDIAQNAGFLSGDVLSFLGDIASVDPFKSSYETGLIAENIRYSIDVTELQTHSRGKPSVFDSVKNRVYTALFSAMPEEDAGIAMSLLFGDKANLARSDYSAVKASGTAHIFAVSGLHVGFLVGAIIFVLKRLKCNDKLTVAITAAVLLFYGFLCGFPASFLRAALMSAVLLFAPLVYRRYDGLSALCFAAVCILLLTPLALFTAGFQMSFAALLGITFLYKPLERWLRKWLKFKFLSGSIALSLSSTACILPVTLAYFGNFSTYFILSNLLVVPWTAVTYLSLLAAMLPAVLAPQVFYALFYPARYLIRGLISVVFLFSSLPLATFQMPAFGVSAAPYYVGVYALSPYPLSARSKKLKVALAAFCAFILLYAVICIVATALSA